VDFSYDQCSVKGFTASLLPDQQKYSLVIHRPVRVAGYAVSKMKVCPGSHAGRQSGRFADIWSAVVILCV
jgi:hypothetical protein